MTGQYLSYVTVDGDTYDMIALDYYNDEYKAALIADANPEYAGVVVFAAGIKLQVPVITREAAASLPPWKRDALS